MKWFETDIRKEPRRYWFFPSGPKAVVDVGYDFDKKIQIFPSGNLCVRERNRQDERDPFGTLSDLYFSVPSFELCDEHRGRHPEVSNGSL